MSSVLRNELRFIRSRLFSKTQTLSTLLAWSILLGSVMAIFTIPPFQKTDEVVHFYKTIAIASGQPFCSADGDGHQSNRLPNYLVQLPGTLRTNILKENVSVPVPRAEYKRILLQTTFDRTMTSEPSACSLPFLFYLPPAIALMVPVLLGLHPFLIFYLGRFAFLLCGLALVYLCIRIIPRPYRLIPLVVAGTPMVLIQLGSYNKEVFHIGLSLVSFALLLAFMEKTIPRTWKPVSLFLGTLVGMVLSRPQYALFLLLPFLLSSARNINHIVGRYHRYGIPAILTGGVVSGSAFVLYWSKFLWFHVYSHDYHGIYPNLQLQYMAENPVRYISTLLTTFTDSGSMLLSTMIGAYGWNHEPFHWLVYAIYFAVFILVAYTVRRQVAKLGAVRLLFLSILVAGTVLGICTAMYVYSTPVGYPSIRDLQGRYFIGLLPYVILFLAYGFYLVERRRWTIAVVVGMVMVSVFSSLYTRYFEYSGYTYAAGKYVEFQQSAENEVLKLPTVYTFDLEVTSGTELAGIAVFHPSKYGEYTTKPWELQVLDTGCITVLSSSLVTPSRVEENAFYRVIFNKPVLLTQSKVCVRLRPYGELTKNETFPLLLNNPIDREVVAYPLFSH